MTDQEVEVIEEIAIEEDKTFLDGLRRVLLAGVGVVVLAQEEIEEFVRKLVDRGEIAEKDGRKLITDVLERRRKDMQETTRRAGDEVDTRIEAVLKRLNVPTQSEIHKLSEQISELSAKVDQLRENSR